MQDELADYPVVLAVPVAWGDMDAFSHLNNTVYFRYFESARIAYFEKMGIYEPGSPRGVGPILASTACRFRAPLTYPDNVRVGARVRDLGEDRFTMEYLVYSERLARVAATGEAVVVAYDYQAASKTRVPDPWRQAMADLAGEPRA